MGVDDPHRLQVGVDDDGPHKLHAPAFQVLRDRIRQLRADPARLKDRFPLCPVPEVAVEAPPLLPDGPEDPGVVHGGADLQLVADDAGVLLQCRQLFLAVCADLLQVEAVEGPAEGLPLVENALPGEPRLEALQNQHFKQPPVVVDGDAPLLVMVSDIQGIFGVGPAAPLFLHGLCSLLSFPSS